MKYKIKLALLLVLSLSFLGGCNNQSTSSNPEVEKELSNGYLQEIKFVENDDSRAMILERQPGEEETTVSDVKIESYDIKPDYHRLVQAIMDMKDDLEVSENADSYKLEIKDKAMDIIKYIQEEYIINVSDLDEDQIEKTIEVEIDKETKLLKKFVLGLKPKVKELEGNKLTAETILSDHELGN